VSKRRRKVVVVEYLMYVCHERVSLPFPFPLSTPNCDQYDQLDLVIENIIRFLFAKDIPELRLFKAKCGPLLKDREGASLKQRGGRSFMDLVHGRAEDWATKSTSQEERDVLERRLSSSGDSLGNPSKREEEIHIPQSVEDAILYGKKTSKKTKEKDISMMKDGNAVASRKQQQSVSSEDFLKRVSPFLHQKCFHDPSCVVAFNNSRG
jgi:hypothetical protein